MASSNSESASSLFSTPLRRNSLQPLQATNVSALDGPQTKEGLVSSSLQSLSGAAGSSVRVKWTIEQDAGGGVDESAGLTSAMLE